MAFKLPVNGRHVIRHMALGWFPTWQRKELPGYGSAQQYAFDTLSLAPRNASNGFAVPVTVSAFSAPQIEHVQQVRLDGYGLPAGTMALPTLYDPSANLGKLGK